MFGRGTSRKTIVVGKEALARCSLLPPIESTSRQVVAFPSEGSLGEGYVSKLGELQMVSFPLAYFYTNLEKASLQNKKHISSTYKIGHPCDFPVFPLYNGPKRGHAQCRRRGTSPFGPVAGACRPATLPIPGA